MNNRDQKSIRVKLFGSLREFGQSNAEIEVPAARTVPELRQTLVRFFHEFHPDSKAAEILKDSAFADEREVLSADAELEGRAWIAVLPPVCGG